MMSRFTESAQEALQRAQQVMFAKQHTQLDIEHLFFALLQQRNSVATQIITKLGGDSQAMMRRLEVALNKLQTKGGHPGASTTGYITLRCNRVLQGAAEEADRLNDDFISTEHILLAIANERGGTTGTILQEVNIDQEKIHEVLKSIGKLELRARAGLAGSPQIQPPISVVNPPELVKPIGYSHGIRATGSDLLFLAGQIAIDREGKLVTPGDVVGQYRQVLVNLESVVGEAGGEMSNIVKLTIYVKDRDDYRAHLKELGEVHREFFGTYYPATALVEVSRFFEEGVLVEIEGIAVI
jgi:enamine deaminase RidA (YjgF/YER057c/UK114 family)